MSVKTDDQKYVAGTYARFPVEIVRGSGCLAYDENGKEYIDLGSGIAVNIFGYSDPEWSGAVKAQIDKFQHTSNLYFTEPCVTLAKKLCGRTGMKKVFFGNSGAEANECAVKAARKYAELKGKSGAKIITLKNSFHGRTITTLAATGQDVFHNDFLPLTEGFLYADANDFSSVESLANGSDVSAVMFECIQGEGGVVPLDRRFVTDVCKFAAKRDILIVVDEVQTGNGRTGKLFSYMNYGIDPDIVTTAKGLGGGLPIGACILGDKVKDVLGAGMHGSTFGGNPVCCAGAVNIIDRIDENLLSSVIRKSELIVNTLNGAKGVTGVTGMGLMLGIETERDASDVIKECIEGGVLVLKAKNKLRLLPPLNIPDELLAKALEVIKTACAGQEK